MHTGWGSTTAGIDAAPISMAGGSISGTVTGVAGRLLAGVQVRSEGGVVGRTGADGTYHLDAIPAGVDAVHVDPDSVQVAGAPYGYLSKDSDPVAVTARADTAGVNVQLAAQSRILGRVVTSTGAHFSTGYVEVFGPGGPHYGDIDTSDGSYTVTGLAGGTYTVCFHGERPTTSRVPLYDWADQCADNVGWPLRFISPPEASSLTVTAGTQRIIDATIQPAGAIAGTVRTGQGGAGVDSAEITIFDSVTHAPLRTALSGSDGTYLVDTGLVATSAGYVVCVNGSLANRGSVCKQNVPWSRDQLVGPDRDGAGDGVYECCPQRRGFRPAAGLSDPTITP